MIINQNGRLFAVVWDRNRGLHFGYLPKSSAWRLTAWRFTLGWNEKS